jgi:hypothetical protein
MLNSNNIIISVFATNALKIKIRFSIESTLYIYMYIYIYRQREHKKLLSNVVRAGDLKKLCDI